MSSQKSPIRFRIEDNWTRGQELLDASKADLVMLVYDFSQLESTTPYAQIYCIGDSNKELVQRVFPEPEARLVSYDDGKWGFYLDGEGEPYKLRLLDSLPDDDSWDFIDLRYEIKP